MTLQELLLGMETNSPEVLAHRAKLPADVQAVIADFEKDYLLALMNFKEAYVATISWAMRARDEMQMLRSYLEAEKLSADLGLKKPEMP